jgi:hypothetical protein
MSILSIQYIYTKTCLDGIYPKITARAWKPCYTIRGSNPSIPTPQTIGAKIPLVKLYKVLIALILLSMLAACVNRTPTITQEKATDIAWNELLPNTASQSRSNWGVKEIRRVRGSEVIKLFAGTRFTNCQGPEPPENQAIKISSEYWFINAAPLPATPQPDDTDNQAGSPPGVPEPLLLQAQFLIDVFDGEVVARRYTCVNY